MVIARAAWILCEAAQKAKQHSDFAASRRPTTEDTHISTASGHSDTPGKTALMTPLAAEVRRQANNALIPGE
jgi:hypothetical protein